MAERERVGIVSVPWMGVPPKGQGSIAGKTHRLTELLADRFDFTIVGGATGRAPAREHPNIDYVAIDERLDRRYLDRLLTYSTRAVGRGRHLYYQPLYHAAYIRRAARALARARCAVVVVHEFPQWLPILRRTVPDARFVLWGGADSFIEVDSLLPSVRLADQLIAATRTLATRFVERVPDMAHRTHVVYSGIDTDTFQPGATPRAAAQLLYAGRVTPEKGVHHLVDAFRELAPSHPDLELVLAGPPWVTDPALLPGSVPHHLDEVTELAHTDYAAELVRRAGPYADRLRMPGSLDRGQLVEQYQRATIFCHPVLCEEGFAGVVAEALSCGAPVVVSDLGGPPEYLTDGRSGCIVPAGDVASLTSTLDDLLRDPAARRAMSVAARDLAENRLSARAAAETLTAVLDGTAPPAQRPPTLV